MILGVRVKAVFPRPVTFLRDRRECQRLLHWFVLRQESKFGGDYHDVRGRTVSSYQIMALRLGLLTCARDSELPATPARG